MTRVFLLALLTVAALGLASAAAQDQPPPDLSRIEQLRGLDTQETTDLAPDMLQPELLGEEGTAAMRKALAAYYAYRVSGYQHRQRVFAWQLLSSRIIFVMVIFLV